MTSIEWTDVTWNPVRGCSRVSAGCEHCYAEGVARRFAGPGQPYEGLVRLDREGKPKAQWNGVVRVVDEHIDDPLFWRRPRRVFVNSMSDLFHEALEDRAIVRVFAVMALAEQHTFQVLTKRPARMRSMLDDPRFWSGVVATAEELTRTHPTPTNAPKSDGGWVGFEAWAELVIERKRLPNVWLGVSVEDQRTADERIPVLLSLPAAVRWVSYEPALGAVDFSRWLPMRFPRVREDAPPIVLPAHGGGRGLDWIVVGGESGPGARVCDLSWVRWTIEQCREAGTPAFVKQLGAVPRGPRVGAWNELLQLRHRKGGDMSEWPEDLRVRKWPEVTRG